MYATLCVSLRVFLCVCMCARARVCAYEQTWVAYVCYFRNSSFYFYNSRTDSVANTVKTRV